MYDGIYSRIESRLFVVFMSAITPACSFQGVSCSSSISPPTTIPWYSMEIY
uniref:Uncharacterized protein n=1 Tax=uncultured marine virus TaxID=186617 RepID=A0A0F7L5C2_9VIRU|nr:hypothetical protein [uncultured marine virus]